MSLKVGDIVRFKKTDEWYQKHNHLGDLEIVNYNGMYFRVIAIKTGKYVGGNGEFYPHRFVKVKPKGVYL